MALLYGSAFGFGAAPVFAATVTATVSGTATTDSTFYGVMTDEMVTLEFTYDDTAPSLAFSLVGTAYGLISASLNGMAFDFDTVEIVDNFNGNDFLLVYGPSVADGNAFQIGTDDLSTIGDEALTSLANFDGVLGLPSLSGFLEGNNNIAPTESVSFAAAESNVPLPPAMALMLAGLAGLGWAGRRRR